MPIGRKPHCPLLRATESRWSPRCLPLQSWCVCQSLRPGQPPANSSLSSISSSSLLRVFVICRCCSAQYLYWASKDIPDNPSERINNVEFLYERQFHPNVGNAVMATSYALLCYLAHNDMKDSVPIMKFITSQRNHLMGWSSTSVRPATVQALTWLFEQELLHEYRLCG